MAAQMILPRACSAKALVTPQARGNIICAAIVCLLRQIWICKACPPQLHYIRLSGLNDFFHLGRIIQRAYTGHGRLHMLLNLCSQIYIYPSFIEGGWMRAAEHIRIFVVSAGYIDQIHTYRSSGSSMPSSSRSSPLWSCHHRISWLRSESGTSASLTASRASRKNLAVSKVRRTHLRQFPLNRNCENSHPCAA